MSKLWASVEPGYCACGCGQRTPLAHQTDNKWGRVAGQPTPFCAGHRRSRPLTEMYAINPDTGCWEWQLAIHKKGYGKLKRFGRTFLAHRAFYEELVGPIPEGLQIDHLCKNRACVNPDHLEPVTQLENRHRQPNYYPERHGDLATA